VCHALQVKLRQFIRENAIPLGSLGCKGSLGLSPWGSAKPELMKQAKHSSR